MNQSESIAALSASLAKAQGVMEGASKDSSNPFFKSSYSSLSAVWEACRKPLSDNGLSVVQTSEFIPEHPDMVCIETVLCHASGEWIKGRLAVKPVKPDPQSVGSCITYLRRYSLQSMVGIAPEDDDGNAASGQGKPPAKKEAAKRPIETEQKQDVPPPSEYPEFNGPKLATKEQVQKIQIILKNRGITDRDAAIADYRSFCKRVDINSSKDMTFSEANDFIKANVAEEAA